MGKWKAHSPLDMGQGGNKQIIRIADAILSDDVPAFHQITDVSAAQFLTLATNSSLANERVFTPSSGLTAVDGGAGAAYTITNDVLTGKSGGQTWVGGTASGNPLTIKANLSNNGILLINAAEIRGESGDGSNSLTLMDGAGNPIFRGLVTNAWSDSALGAFFQVGGSSQVLAFTARYGTVFPRLQFTATSTQFTMGPYNTTPVPGGIFEVLNASQVVQFRVTTTDAMFASLGGGSDALTMSSTTGILQRVTLGTNLSFSGTTLNAATGVPASRTLTAGTGMTGGGDLTVDRTFNVIANGDATIVVNANDIQAGVMQTANYAAGSVTFAKIEALTSSHLLGRGSASSGNPESIIIGTGLAMTGTTLSATATSGAPTDAQYLTLATHSSLSAERVLNMTTGFTVSDGGANGNYTVTNDVFTGQSGSPTWQGSSNSNNLTIKANTSSTGLLTAVADEFLVTISGTAITDSSDKYGFYVSPPSSPNVSNGVAASLWATCIIAQRSYACPSGSASVTNAASLYISAAPSVASGSLTMTNKYAIFVDSGISRFDGNGSLTVFEVPDNNHTVSTTLADRCIQVEITGVGIRYIRLYLDGA